MSGGGAGSTAGFADLRGFADYAFASQRWGETCGTVEGCRENWWQVSWAANHGFADPGWSAVIYREVQFGRLRGDYLSIAYNGITPEEDFGRYRKAYSYLNQLSEVWDSNDPTALAWLMAHELSHGDALRRGWISIYDTEDARTQEETRANCVAGRAVGRRHPELTDRGEHVCS